jgi:hypothetical protein
MRSFCLRFPAGYQLTVTGPEQRIRLFGRGNWLRIYRFSRLDFLLAVSGLIFKASCSLRMLLA